MIFLIDSMPLVIMSLLPTEFLSTFINLIPSNNYNNSIIIVQLLKYVTECLKSRNQGDKSHALLSLSQRWLTGGLYPHFPHR